MKKIFTLVLLCSLFQSCIFLAGPIAKGQANKYLTVEKNAIPSDLGADDSYVVCVLEERESRDKYLRKYFDQNYKGNFVYATRAELASEKFSDVNMYRYIFTYERLSGGVYHISDQTTTPLRSSNYFIFDRKTNTEYNSTFSSSFFGKMLDSYTTNMEKQRQLNKAAI